MPSGWDEFLEKTKRQAASEEPVDLHALWSEFLQRSQGSPRAEALQHLAEAVQRTPIYQRMTVAVVVASLLAHLEWPSDLEQHRTNVVLALRELMDTVAPNKPESLVAHLAPGSGGEISLAEGGLVLSSASVLLTTCRQEELRVVVGLCNLGLSQMMRLFRWEFARRRGQPLDQALLRSKVRFDAALERYVQAARAFNSAVGAVLFEYLDERLDISET